MNALLTQLSRGTPASDIPREFSAVVSRIEAQGYLKNRDGFLEFGSKYRAGILHVATSGQGFVQLLGSDAPDLLIEPANLAGGREGDYVIAQRLIGRSGRPRGRVAMLLQRARAYEVGYVKPGPIPTACFLKTDLPMPLEASDLPEPGSVFQVEALSGKITKILGRLEDPKVDEPVALALFNKQEAFSPEALAEAKRFGNRVDASRYGGRMDLRDLPFCTIDPVDAKDFDDAVCWDRKHNVLYVAIADVSHYVAYDSAIDFEARQRGFSIYFPHKSIPMLPRELSENICSLKPDADRLAYVCEMHLDPARQKVKSHRFYEALIRSKRRFTYEEIDAYLNRDKTPDVLDESLLEFLYPLFALTQKFRRSRLQEGYDFHSPEIRMVLDAATDLQSTRVEASTPSHSLIEECMLLANQAAASHFEHGFFRIHAAPDPAKIETLQDELAKIGLETPQETATFHELVTALQRRAEAMGIREYVDQLIIQTQKQAAYASQNIGHFGLGFDLYTHFTSPIRRYADLMVHRLLKAIFAGRTEEREYLLRNAEPICLRVSQLEREATLVEWNYMDRKFARWAAANPDENMLGIVMQTGNETRIRSLSPLIGMQMACADDTLELFDQTRTRWLNVSIATAKILVTAESRIPLAEHADEQA